MGHQETYEIPGCPHGRVGQGAPTKKWPQALLLIGEQQGAPTGEHEHPEACGIRERSHKQADMQRWEVVAAS